MALLNDNSLCWQTAETIFTVLWESLRDGKLDWSWGDANIMQPYNKILDKAQSCWRAFHVMLHSQILM